MSSKNFSTNKFFCMSQQLPDIHKKHLFLEMIWLIFYRAWHYEFAETKHCQNSNIESLKYEFD